MPIARKPSDAKTTTTTIAIKRINRKTFTIAIIGERPLILNKVSEKARRELLFPSGGRRTTAERRASLKHDPHAEFLASPYVLKDEDAPTLLAIKAEMPKAAMMDAALDLEGVNRTQIGRLLWVVGEMLPVWGVPQLLMSVVRNADPQRTPDVRTRCIIPRWATILPISYTTPHLTQRSVVNLCTAAGQICGIGDYRPQKGKGTYGMFQLADPEDPAFLKIVAEGGRAQQIAGMDAQACYDDETEELLTWFDEELVRRDRVPEEEAASDGRADAGGATGAADDDGSGDPQGLDAGALA